MLSSPSLQASCAQCETPPYKDKKIPQDEAAAAAPVVFPSLSACCWHAVERRAVSTRGDAQQKTGARGGRAAPWPSRP
eukprot:12649028-Heterocapsa_arctica.AAC.1